MKKYKIRSKQPITQEFMHSVLAYIDNKDIDQAALMMLESNIDLFVRCAEEIEQSGLLIMGAKGLAKNPLIKVQTDAQIQAVKLLNDLELTPKMRNKKNVQNDQSGTDINPQFAAFLSRGDRETK